MDPDAGTDTLTITLQAAHGTLTLGAGAVAVSGNGTAQVLALGALADLNAALAGLVYRGADNYNSTFGAESIVLSVEDGGSSGSTGPTGALTGGRTLLVTVDPVNDAPIAAPKAFAAQANMKSVGFAINLGPTSELDADPCGNVHLPDSNLQGILEPPRQLETMVQFGNRLKDCLQNWADNAQTHVPGYRDRIVEVLHTKDEGGMNLDMGPDAIAGLALRGRCAGAG